MKKGNNRDHQEGNMPRQKKKKSTSKPNIRKQRAGSLLLFSIGVVLLLGLLNLSTGFITDRLLWGFQWLFGKATGILAALFFFFAYRVFKGEELKLRDVLDFAVLFLLVITLVDLLASPAGSLKDSYSVLLNSRTEDLHVHLVSAGGTIGLSLAYVMVAAIGRMASFVILLTASSFYLIHLLINDEVKKRFAAYRNKRKNERKNKKMEAVEKPVRKKKVQKPKKAVEPIETAPLQSKSLDQTIKHEPIPVAKAVKKQKSEAPKELVIPSQTHSGYQRPGFDLLKRGNQNPQHSNMHAKEQGEQLVALLQSFGVESKILNISYGPSITRFELQPAPGVKISRIKNLSDDIALGMASADVRIEAPIPGKKAIGIEVPNEKKQMVLFREVIETPQFQASESNLTIGLGKTIAGKPLIADIEKMPHLLIAGATGSGKSVCVNTIICSILYKASPEEVKLLLIDPKMVELTAYNQIPHLLIPVVVDPKKAASALHWAVGEMTKRYKLFSEERVRNYRAYNEKMMDQEGAEAMPQIVIIIDELADLMMTSPGEVEDSICRLAQMARAAGIHLIVATQRPSVDVITGLIKANIPSRISFAVSSQVDSRTILDMAGAEKLLGKGDMLFYPVGASKPIRTQGAFISEEEVNRLVQSLAKPAEFQEELVMELEKPKIDTSRDALDSLYETALQLVIDEQRASTSLIQRRLKVGYARAGRIIDQLEENGMVSGHQGSKARSVLVAADYLTSQDQKEDSVASRTEN
jgi:S-DNA-T family DNA segregation ATPase FtsK/SpoIIIE